MPSDRSDRGIAVTWRSKLTAEQADRPTGRRQTRPTDRQGGSRESSGFLMVVVMLLRLFSHWVVAFAAAAHGDVAAAVGSLLLAIRRSLPAARYLLLAAGSRPSAVAAAFWLWVQPAALGVVLFCCHPFLWPLLGLLC